MSMNTPHFLTAEAFPELNHKWEIGLIYLKRDEKDRHVIEVFSDGVAPVITYIEYDDDNSTVYVYNSYGRRKNTFREMWFQVREPGNTDRVWSRGQDGSVIDWAVEKFVKRRETPEYRAALLKDRICEYDLHGNKIYHKDIDGFEMIRDLDNYGNLIKLTVKNVAGV